MPVYLKENGHKKYLKGNQLVPQASDLFIDKLYITLNIPIAQQQKAIDTFLTEEDNGWLPSYYLDGIHTKGKDRRFTGMPASMYGMCRAYKKFGRLHPDDQWPSDFWWKIEDK